MQRKVILICVLAAVCALGIVATALATSTATHHSSSHHHGALRRSTQTHGPKPSEAGAPPAGGPGAQGGAGGPGAVHSESVVLNKAGTAFITETTDSGTVHAVEASAGKLTLVEEAKSVVYKTLTLSISSEAKVTLDGKSSSLSSLATGDRVTVTSSSEGTTVFALDSSFHPEGAWAHGGAPPGGQPPASE